MTAALYARLVEQGRAEWGASVPRLFYDLDLHPGWQNVRIEHLLSHRSGILDSIVMPVWMLIAREDLDVRILRNRLAGDVLGDAPGEVGGFSYSNAGYILAGAAIERITGEPWEDTMRREVFEPLGMASAGFGAPLGDNAWGHQRTTLRPRDPAAPIADNPAALGPAGTVHASLEDYARFLRVFLTGGGGWLSPESLDILTRPAAGPPPAYAAGWGIVASAPWAGSRPAFTHDGSNTMWLARAVVAPGRNAAICVANAAEPARGAVDALTRALIEHLPVR
jgi:CubicO group peptidase (beta-lactamase class C family)